MIVLGIHDGTHDAGAALVVGGRIVAACNEERFTRRKGQGGWPTRSVAACLAAAPGPVERVAFAGVVNPNPVLRAVRPLQDRFHLDDGAFWQDTPTLAGRASEWLQFESAFPRLRGDGVGGRTLAGAVRPLLARRARAAGVDAPVEVVDHHEAHAASAWCTAGAEQGVVVVADGIGDGLSLTTWEGAGTALRRRLAWPYPHAHGLFYACMTGFLGFRPFRHEGKLVGLAAHGNPDAVPLPWPFEGPVDARRFTVGFGPPLRAWLAPLRDCRREDVCAWLQRGLAEDLLALARHEVAAVGGEVLALAGGVFANVRLNQDLAERSGATRLHVFPHMGDGGLAAGAALRVAARHGELAREALPHAFLGIVPDDVDRVLDGLAQQEGEALRRALPPPHQDGSLTVEPFPSPDALARRVAAFLAEGKVVAVCRGPMEYGPRALGNRSILAPADDIAVTTRLNVALDRSDFMPFAPAILAEGHADWIDLPASARHAATFMTVTARARPRMRAELPAAVHVDGTLRPQIVEADRQPFLHAVLTEYHARTRRPAVLNTSFNLHEEPIVESAAQALTTFTRARLDALVLGDALVVRT
jgi:carbamoyltransferase